MGKPSMPVSYEEMLADQANRLANNNFGAGFGGWSPTAGSYSGETSYDYEGEKGNPFFTEENQIPLSTYSGTATNRAPFLWNGNNDSLRNVFQQAYDSYYAGVPQTTSSVQQKTWGGPEIRALYGEQDAGFGYDPTEMYSTGLSNIGTPQYWQDNNKNKVFDDEFDDYLSTSFTDTTGDIPQSPMVDTGGLKRTINSNKTSQGVDLFNWEDPQSNTSLFDWSEPQARTTPFDF